jgi:hypothetical protein
VPELVRTVGELLRALQQLDPDMPVLIESARSGADRAAVDVLVMQELADYGGQGRYQFPTDAERLISRRNAWQISEGGPQPTLVGEVFAAAVIHRCR